MSSCCLGFLAAHRRKRQRCPLHCLQVCQRPSGRLRSRGKDSRGFDCAHLRQSFTAEGAATYELGELG
jgi:hypothetical protein